MTQLSIKFSPLVTEKSSLAMATNKYTFIVEKSVNKIEFSKMIEKNFNVKVVSSNAINLKSKKRRRGRIIGKTVARKKIIITVDQNSKTEKLQSLF